MNKKHIVILAVLAVVIFILGAHAATANPLSVQIGSITISFLPLVITSQAADAPSGVLYVFSSTATTNGNPGGRLAMNDICPSQDPDSHFCRREEIENAWITTGVYFDTSMQDSWVEAFYSSDWSEGANNCDAWTYETSGDNGHAIVNGAHSLTSRTCDTILAVACCKWMP